MQLPPTVNIPLSPVIMLASRMMAVAPHLGFHEGMTIALEDYLAIHLTFPREVTDRVEILTLAIVLMERAGTMPFFEHYIEAARLCSFGELQAVARRGISLEERSYHCQLAQTDQGHPVIVGSLVGPPPTSEDA